jgi:hypothetical protein
METATLIADEVDEAREELESLREVFVSTARWLIGDLETAVRSVEREQPVNSLGVCQSKAHNVDRLCALLEVATQRLERARRIAKSAQVTA